MAGIEPASLSNTARRVAKVSHDPTPSSEQDQADLAWDEAAGGLQALLRLEEDARNARTIKKLLYLIANETRKFSKARQVFVFKQGRNLQLNTISGLPAIDRATPLVKSIEAMVVALRCDIGTDTTSIFALSDYAGKNNSDLQDYPFQALLWIPLQAPGGQAIGGLLLARETPWSAQSDMPVVSRLAGTFAHAWALLQFERRLPVRLVNWLLSSRRLLVTLIAITLLAFVIPVPMTTLAPFEITAKDPFVVAAPLEGVIEEILVEPGASVHSDQPIVRFASTILKNKLVVAEREVLVAEAALKKSTQLAFDDVRGRHELRLSMANHALKLAEFEFARAMFDRATIYAPRNGVALYGDKQSLIGKPVVLGERIMQIADPDQAHVTIDVAVGDAIVLKSGAHVKVFLDSDPLHPRSAKIKFANYEAQTSPGGQLSFRVIAQFFGDERSPLRLGERGTAQVYGEQVPLVVYLFRRPLSALRQWLGI